jgi:hypothetical protein
MVSGIAILYFIVKTLQASAAQAYVAMLGEGVPEFCWNWAGKPIPSPRTRVPFRRSYVSYLQYILIYFPCFTSVLLLFSIYIFSHTSERRTIPSSIYTSRLSSSFPQPFALTNAEVSSLFHIFILSYL